MSREDVFKGRQLKEYRFSKVNLDANVINQRTLTLSNKHLFKVKLIRPLIKECFLFEYFT